MAADVGPGAGLAVVLAGFLAADLLAEAIRHPWLSAVRHRHRVKKMHNYLDAMGLSLPQEVQGEIYGLLCDWMNRNAEYQATKAQQRH